jgi:hypothetical protein
MSYHAKQTNCILLISVVVHMGQLACNAACNRAHRSRGLQQGASPLLLPGPPLVHGAKRHRHDAAPASQENSDRSSELAASMMPRDEVLENSEFLLPLDADTLTLYKEVLSF